MDAAPNKRSYIRLASIRALLMGMERKIVCQMFGRSDRMVRLWIECFNSAGIDGLTTKPRSGRPRKVKLKRVKDLLIPILEDPSKAGEVHWTGVKLYGHLKAELSVELGYSTLIRWLHELDYHRRFPRPWSERKDEENRQEFLKKLKKLQQDESCELWFGDESGFEGDPRPRQRWVKPGEPRHIPYRGDHIRLNVIGSVRPETGEFFSLIVDCVDTDIFQLYLDQMAKTITAKPGKRQILILDNASWHKSKRINWHHFEPMFLPSYSPDFNPVERLWLRVKADWFSDFIASDKTSLCDRLCTALKSFIGDPTKTASICAIRK